MSTQPDQLDPSAVDLLGDRAYPESQVSYGGATYWLERSVDGVKRLVAVADDESAFRGFTGAAERRDGEVRLALAELPPMWLEQATEARSRLVATWRATTRAAFVIAVWLLWWTASLVLLTGFVVSVLVQGASLTNAVAFAALWLACTFIAWRTARGRPLRRR